MAAEMAVRAAVHADAAAIAEIQRASWRSAYRGLIADEYLEETFGIGDAASWRRAMDQIGAEGGFGLVAVSDDEVLGYLFGGVARDDDVERNHVGEVYMIYIAPRWFRHGAGGLLLVAAEEALLAQGCDVAVLWVLEDNRRARRFYEAFGWRFDTARRPFELEPFPSEVRYRREPLTPINDVAT